MDGLNATGVFFLRELMCKIGFPEYDSHKLVVAAHDGTESGAASLQKLAICFCGIHHDVMVS